MTGSDHDSRLRSRVRKRVAASARASADEVLSWLLGYDRATLDELRQAKVTA
jgi:hypothetical protein